MFSIFRDFLATRLVAQFDTLTFALDALTRNRTLVLPEDDDTREDVTITTYGNTLYTGPGGADVTLGPDATLFRLGGDGQATIQTANANSRVYGNSADNIFYGNDARDVFYGGSGADIMDGGAGEDVLYGGGGDDTLITGAGRDRAYGGEGDDLIIASGGQSRLYGGAGDDTYRLDVSGDDLHIIYDFAAGDKIIIDGAGDLNSIDDILAVGGLIHESKGRTIIRIEDAQIQLRDFALADLTDEMIGAVNPTDPVDPVDPVDPIDPIDPVDPVDPVDPIDPVDPPSGPTFDTIAAFLASGQADTLSDVTIDGALYELRDADPVHAGYKFADQSGRFWSQDYFVIVAAGQSNMTGSGVGGDFSLGGNVAAYDWVNDTIIEAAYDAAPAGGAARTGAAIRNNLYFPMADQLAADLDRPVLVIAHPVSGSRITTWLESGTGENWDTLNPEVSAALAHVGQTQADAFIWHQGESDYPLSSAQYKPQAQELVTQVRAQDWAGDDLPFLFGELSRDGVNFGQNVTLQELEVANTDPNIGFVSSAGLISEEASGVHFNGESLNILGGRYFEVLKGILDGITAAPNTAPVVNANANVTTDITIAEGQELRLDVSDYFTDAEGDDLYHYAYLNKRNVYLARTDDQTEDVMVLRPTYDHAGTYTLFLYANDFNLDSDRIEINLTVTDATPLISTYNNRFFGTVTGSYRDYDAGIAALDPNRGFDILDQAAFNGNANRVLDIQTAHIRGDADISARFVLDADIRQAYFYGEAVFDVVGNGLDNYLVGADGGSDMYGGGGRDRLYGNGGDDTLYGGTNDDQLYGGDGDDLLIAERGKDQAYGGAGDDTFVFRDNDQQLYIRDFEAGDVVQVSGFAGISDFDDLVSTALLRDSNGRIIIDLDDDRLMIADTTVADLTADMFDFV